jgi:hypothetical protein
VFDGLVLAIFLGGSTVGEKDNVRLQYQAALEPRGRSPTTINFRKMRKEFCEISCRYNSGPKTYAGFQLSDVKAEPGQELRLPLLCKASAVFQIKERDDHN